MNDKFEKKRSRDLVLYIWACIIVGITCPTVLIVSFSVIDKKWIKAYQ
jgi:hypothetical protein